MFFLDITHYIKIKEIHYEKIMFTANPLNSELNLICNLLALLRAHHILHVSRARVNRSC